MQPIFQLLSSRKAIVMLASLIGVVLLAALGKIPGAQAVEFCKWVVMTWLGAQALVDATTRAKTPPPAQSNRPMPFSPFPKQSDPK